MKHLALVIFEQDGYASDELLVCFVFQCFYIERVDVRVQPAAASRISSFEFPVGPGSSHSSLVSTPNAERFHTTRRKKLIWLQQQQLDNVTPRITLLVCVTHEALMELHVSRALLSDPGNP